VASPLYDLHQAPPTDAPWFPSAISDSGVVLGWSPFENCGVIWDGDSFELLPVDFRPWAINDVEDEQKIVGEESFDSPSSKAFLYVGGQMIDLSQKVGVGVPNFAIDINNSGLVAGNNNYHSLVLNPPGPTKVFVYDSTADTLVAVLDRPAGSDVIFAKGINANGHLAGNIVTGSGATILKSSVFLCKDGNTIETFGAGVARAFNKFDLITGEKQFNDGSHGFRLDAATPNPTFVELAPLNCLQSVGMDITDDGTVVLLGVMRATGNPFGGFVAFPDTSTYAGIWDLKDSLTTDVSFVEIVPHAINNKGQIAAYVVDVQGNTVAVRIDPVALHWAAAIGKKASEALLEFVMTFGGVTVGAGGWQLTAGGHLIPVPPRQDFIAFWQRLPRPVQEAAVAEAIRKLALLIDDPRKTDALQKATFDILGYKKGAH
jgi:hypothetical protein